MTSQRPRQARPMTSEGLPQQALAPTRMDPCKRKGRCKRRKWCSAQFTSSVPSCRGLDRGTLVCRSCFSASSWPLESCAITSKHTRSQWSLAFRLRGYCRIPKQQAGLSSGFESTSTIQSRALAEFIAEWTPTPDEEIPETSIPGKEASKDWLMYFDGAFSLEGAGAGVLLIAPTGEHLKYIVQMHFPMEQATNNIAEYEGLLASLWIAAELGIKKLVVRGDSQLVVRQVNKDYQSP